MPSHAAHRGRKVRMRVIEVESEGGRCPNGQRVGHGEDQVVWRLQVVGQEEEQP